MRQIFTPTVRITLGMVSLTISLLLAAQMLGLVPDRVSAALEARQSFVESLAVQLSWSASRNDKRAIQKTMDTVVERNEDLLSAAFRNSRGKINAFSGDHDKHWVVQDDELSTPTHVHVPVFHNGKPWGTVELAFEPLESLATFSSFAKSPYGALAFFAFVGFALYFLFLRRALQELDPSAVIPERVKAAFDVLAEGLIIVDENGFIVLANRAFGELIGRDSNMLTGANAAKLGWMSSVAGEKPKHLPWELSIEDRSKQNAVPLLIAKKGEDARTLMVNGAPIMDGSGKVRGALATFDDITDLERRNNELRETLDTLHKSRAEVKRQNEELRFLATRDPLTGCLNRRAAFERFEQLLQEVGESGDELCCIMTDIDHFKRINDRYGHAAGDKVIKFVARLLRDSARVEDIVARYGGEEFCIVLPGVDIAEGAKFAERLREAIEVQYEEKFSSSQKVRISLGVANFEHGKEEGAMDLVNRADQALYAAKENGRNRVVRWDDPLVQSPSSTDDASADGDSAIEKTMLVEKADLMTQTLQVQTLDGQAGVVEKAFAEKSLEMHRKHGFDELTGLPNRVLFYDRVGQAIASARREGKFVATLNLDVQMNRQTGDKFESIEGDDALKFATKRLADILRENDAVTNLEADANNVTISRLATTEFGVSLADLADTETATWIIQRLFDAMSMPIETSDGDVFANCTIGVSVYPNDGLDVETLIRHASTARHHAKSESGRHKFMFFAQEMNERSYKQIKLESEMRKAIENDEFQLYFQPAFDVHSGHIVSLEALIRWQHPDHGLMSPDEFIPIAEHTGFINDIGEWVMRTACNQLKAWQNQGIADIGIAVNLSAVQLRSESLETEVEAIVTESGLDPKYVELEVTETALMDDVQNAQRVLQRIRDIGVKIAIDDFGTGYSSLSHLKHFVIDKLKIDKSFINDVTHDKRDAAVVGATIAMAKLLEASVVAEGVETEAQLEFLRKRHCDFVQGYLLSRPLTADRACELLKADIENRPVDLEDRLAESGKFQPDYQNGEPAAAEGKPDTANHEKTQIFDRILS